MHKVTGQIRWVEGHATPIMGENGEILRFEGTVTDITDRKKMENDLKKTIKELKQFKEVTVGRENQMIELKKEINRLSRKLGKPEPYNVLLSEEANREGDGA